MKDCHLSPSFYRAVLDEGKDIINESAYKKSRLALQKMFGNETTPIARITSYMKDSL